MSTGKISFSRGGRQGVMEVDDTNDVSDGYHRIGELYEHRTALFALVVALSSRKSWRSRVHEDGTMFDGMFIVGWETENGPCTYHVDLEHWDLFDYCTTLDAAPPFDGHTSQDVLERLVMHLGTVFALRDNFEPTPTVDQE